MAKGEYLSFGTVRRGDHAQLVCGCTRLKAAVRLSGPATFWPSWPGYEENNRHQHQATPLLALRRPLLTTGQSHFSSSDHDHLQVSTNIRTPLYPVSCIIHNIHNTHPTFPQHTPDISNVRLPPLHRHHTRPAVLSDRSRQICFPITYTLLRLFSQSNSRNSYNATGVFHHRVPHPLTYLGPDARRTPCRQCQSSTPLASTPRRTTSLSTTSWRRPPRPRRPLSMAQ